MQGPLLSWKIKPGCRIVGLNMEKLTTWADFQLSFHWLQMSTRIRSYYKNFLHGKQARGRLVISEWIGQLSWAIIFSISLYVAAFLWREGGSMLVRTGKHGRLKQDKCSDKTSNNVVCHCCDTDFFDFWQHNNSNFPLELWGWLRALLMGICWPSKHTTDNALLPVCMWAKYIQSVFRFSSISSDLLFTTTKLLSLKIDIWLICWQINQTQ